MRDGEVVVDRLVCRHDPAPGRGRHGRARSQSRLPRLARPCSRRGSAAPRLSVENLSVRGALENANFVVRAGEVLGVTGLAGSGLNELSRAIFGASARPATGRVMVDGAPVPPVESVRLAPGGDRAHHQRPPARGRAARLSAHREHLPAGPVALWRRARRPRIAATMERTAVRNIERLRIRTPGPLALARQLSGGNQQKVLFAKWLETGPKVFVMDEPTIGVDVGAKDEIRKIIDEVAAAGVGVLLVTTELDELVCLVRPRADHVPRRDRRRACGRGDRTARNPASFDDGSDSGGGMTSLSTSRRPRGGGRTRASPRGSSAPTASSRRSAFS